MHQFLANNHKKETEMKFSTCLIAIAALAVSSACFADQPYMHEALKNLTRAKDALQNADADKGGHRANAIRAVNAAINEVEAGIEYDRAHQSKEERKGRRK
jgi:hypothetical protein